MNRPPHPKSAIRNPQSPLVLLLGGTSETGPIARGLAQAGYGVLVSTATDEPLDLGATAVGRARRRVGRLDAAAMLALVGQQSIRAIVDASHPYAAKLRSIAPAVAAEAGIPYVSYMRPGLEENSEFGIRNSELKRAGWNENSEFRIPHSELLFAADHEAAARIAFSIAQSAIRNPQSEIHAAVLLTTGSQNLTPYVSQANQSGVGLAVRILPREDSIRACLQAGISREFVIAAKGPFSVEVNREHIRRFGAVVLVTKDSGQAGGVDTKLAAARLEGCQVVVVQRPAVTVQGQGSGRDSRTTEGQRVSPACTSVDELIAAVRQRVPIPDQPADSSG